MAVLPNLPAQSPQSQPGDDDSQSDGAQRILLEEVTDIILTLYTYTSGGLDGAGQSQSDAGC